MVLVFLIVALQSKLKPLLRLPFSLNKKRKKRRKKHLSLLRRKRKKQRRLLKKHGMSLPIAICVLPRLLSAKDMPILISFMLSRSTSGRAVFAPLALVCKRM